MGNAVTYPTGETLTTSAMTPEEMSELWQGITCTLTGRAFDPSFVRIAWQTQGQPSSQLPGVDVCYLSCVPEDVDYSRIRDYVPQPGTGTTEGIWLYTKGWRTSWIFYGPNATANAQLVWSGMFQEWTSNYLSLSNLYPIPDFRTPQRVPELINGQWWERCDFDVVSYEQVTEVLTTQAASSVEVKVYSGGEQVADIEVR